MLSAHQKNKHLHTNAFLLNASIPLMCHREVQVCISYQVLRLSQKK